jgi:ribonuclease BN (tRNA processing enzyme)
MRLLLLGTTGYHPNARRHTSCFFLPDVGVVLDAGTGMFRVRHHLATPHLDIFLSHVHLDHVIGLTYLFDIVHEKPIERVTVHAEAEKLEVIQRHLLTKLLFPVPLPCEYRPLDGDVPLPNGGNLRHFPLPHPGGSRGFRLDWPGHSLAYVTDTTACASAKYVELIRGVDVLVHECYMPDGYEQYAERTGHSCVTPVATVARDAKVGRLILVHCNPLDETDDPVGLKSAQAVFPASEMGSDLDEIEF